MTNRIRSTKLAALAAVAVTGLSAGQATAASYVPTTSTTIAAPAPEPQAKWTYKKWLTCFKLAYANAREDGLSIQGADAEASLVCGDAPK